MTDRRSAFTATFLLALLCSAPTLAQTVSGNIPRVETPLTWQRPDGGCSGATPINPTTRRYQVVKFVTTGAGNYTMTATRSDGGFIALDNFGNSFTSAAGFECVNRNNLGAPSGMGSVSDTFSCVGPICSSGTFEQEVVISVGPSETVPITFTISGGPAVSFGCGTDNQGYFTPASSVFGSAGGSGSAVFTPGSSLGCTGGAWTATATSWITGVPSSGSGGATINFNVGTNSTGSTRNGSFSISRMNGIFTVTTTHTVQQTAAAACTYAFSPTSESIGAAAGSDSFAMTSGASCAWTTSESTSWINGVTASGTSNGTISYNYDANSGPARSGTITSQGQTYTANQANGCTISLSAATVSPGAGATTGSVSIDVSDAACQWTLGSNQAFVSGLSAASGTGDATVTYNIAANTGNARSATLTGAINGNGNSDTQVVNQASGCTISISPATASPSAAGGAASATLTTGSNCAWTLGSSQAFVSGFATSGTGTTTINYSVAANTGNARSATLTGTLNVGGATDTLDVNQASGCTISISPATASPSAAGGAASATLTTGSNCAWTLGSSQAFVSGFATSGTGTTTINYSVAANTSVARSATLTGTLTLGGATDTLDVNQGDGCTAMVSPTTISTDGSAQTENVTLTMSNAACPFTSSTTGGFITVSPSTGTGSQTIGLQLTANTGASRGGSATIAGQTVNVTQASSCTISVTAASVNAGSGASAGSLDITAPAGCAWTVGSNNAFVSGFSASGSGTANVSYNIAANPGLPRSATLTAALTSTGATDTHVVNQGDGCSSSVSSGTIAAAGTAHAETVTLTMSDAACPFTVSTATPWITPTPTSGTGTTTINLALTANTGAARSGSATLDGHTVTVNQASVCTISVGAVANVGAAAGSGSFALTTQAGCAWTLASSAGFVSGFSASGTGPATVDYDYAANVSIARSATLTATLTATSATAAHVVNQASGCVASLADSSATPTEAAGSDSVALTLSDSACPWAASSDADWLTLPTAAGTGDATLDFDFEANIGPERTGTITVLGETFEVTQASGCVVSVAASQAIVSSMGTGSVAIDTEPGCTWTATTTTPWLSNVTASGSGDGTINFDYAVNLGSDRTGTIAVASSLTSSTDSHEIVQGNGCVAMLDSASDTFGAGATTSSVMLTLSAADCTWSASSSDPWLTLDAGSMSGTGSATVGFAVTDNVSVDRTATLTIAGQTFTVEQDSGCAIVLTPAAGNAMASGNALMFDVATDAACAWTATEDADWLSGLIASGTGPTTIALTADANVGPMREADVVFTATDTGATATYEASQSDGCVATLASEALSAGSAAESGSVGVTFSSQSCAWTAASDAFITVTNATGTGDATLMFDIGANVGPSRTGTITLYDETFTITQANGCVVVLSPDSASEESAAGTTQLELQTGAGCTWDAMTESDWITGFAADGTGTTTLDVDFSANEGPERTGTIEIEVSSGATTSFELTQGNGCAITLPVDAADAPAAGGESSFAVMTGEGCDYTFEVDASWIEASLSDTGVEYEVAAWDGAERVAEIIVTSTTTESSATFTVTQASGCSLMLTPGDVRVSADGESVSFVVSTGSGCTIGATTESDFISNITIEEGTVEAEIAANAGQERMGIIVVTAGDSMGEFVVQQDAADDVAPDGGIEDGGVDGGDGDGDGDGGITVPDAGGDVPDSGYDFEDLQVGGGCNCNVTGRDDSTPNGFAGALIGLVLAWRATRRRTKR
jgi:MYXO-CTERM domain-containing protein